MHKNKSYDSSVDIGITDDVNKGLGFEADFIKDLNHAYSFLSDNLKDILLNMREKVIEFGIKIAGNYFLLNFSKLERHSKS